MTYLDRPTPGKGPPWAHNSLGLSVHTALRLWWELPVHRRTPSAAVVALDKAWVTDGYRDDAQSEHWRDQARGWVESYAASVDPGEEPVGLERTVAARTATLAFFGRVDRIDERDGELVVVDYKTGRRAPTEDDVRGSRALALYAVAASGTLRRPCGLVELHHLPSGTVVSWRHDPDSLDRHVRRAEDAAADIVTATDTLAAGGPSEELFPPRTGRHCGLCDFRRHCPEGQAATETREPWSVLTAP